MTEKEIGEVRRTLTEKRNTVPTVYGCYVNAGGEVIATFQKSFALMDEEESGKYLSLFRRVLSGGIRKNLFDIPFTTKQVTDGEEHKRLMALRGAEDPVAAIAALTEKIIPTVHSEENYLILFARGAYDVIRHRSDGTAGEEESREVYRFAVCAVCPVKTARSALCYRQEEKNFASSGGMSTVGAPEMGFLFPAFDNRSANIYDALFYTRSTEDAHEEFTAAVFGSGIPMTAGQQSATFRTVLADALEEDLSFRVARDLRRQICERMEEHKEKRDPEPLALTRYDMREFLENSGVSGERLDSFSEGFGASFGASGDVAPGNIADPKKFELRTPYVLVKVEPGKENLVRLRWLDGKKVIVIDADEGAELNGMNVRFEKDT